MRRSQEPTSTLNIRDAIERRERGWTESINTIYGMNQMTDNEYLAFQVGLVCVLLFFIAVTAVTQHPGWFG